MQDVGKYANPTPVGTILGINQQFTEWKNRVTNVNSDYLLSGGYIVELIYNDGRSSYGAGLYLLEPGQGAYNENIDYGKQIGRTIWIDPYIRKFRPSTYPNDP
jgi:hypothetical protein